MTVRNQATMSLDDVAALTKRIGSGFLAEAEIVGPAASGDVREIDTLQGRSAFLRGIAAAINADQKGHSKIVGALLADELARQGLSLPSDQEVLLREFVAKDLVVRAHRSADALHDRPPVHVAGTVEDADTMRVVNILRKMTNGDLLSDFVSPDALKASLDPSSAAFTRPLRPEGYQHGQIEIRPLSPPAHPPSALRSETKDSSGLNARSADREVSPPAQPGGQSRAEVERSAASVKAGATGQTFDELWPRFTREKATNTEWGQQQQIQAKSTKRVFVEICDNRHPGAYTKADADDFKLTMLSLPARYAHDKRWCDLRRTEGLKKVAETVTAENEAIRQAHRNGDLSLALHETLSPKAWNRHYSNVAEFWRWADRKGLLTDGNGLIFADLYIDIPKVSGKSEEAKAKRDQWRDPMLIKLFNAPVLTGLRSRYWWKHQGDLIRRDDRYWGCLLGPHQGMRREEFFQLKVRHVVQDEASGIWYFNLKAMGLRLKDIGSPREVPLHDNILQLGFVEERVIGRPPGDMLFPEAIKQDAAGYHGARFGDWFGHLCDWLEVPDNNDFHAFRTTFITRLRGAGVDRDHVDALAGHESIGRRSVQDEYDKGLPMSKLKQLIDQLVLPIDIAALKEAAGRYGKVDFSLDGDD